jgi:hypothetical protein
MRRIGPAARRTRLLRRHHLATWSAAPDIVTAADDVVGLHATDPVSVYLAARARVPGLAESHVAAALYDDRSLVRVTGMRTTMFVVPAALGAVLSAACARPLAAKERTRLVRWLAEAGLGDPEGTTLAALEAATLAALHERGEATASDLVAAVPGLGAQLPFGVGRAWQGVAGVSTRVLFLLAADGRILRGRPTGTLVSSRYRWVAVDRWIPGGLPALDTDGARVALVRRYLEAYGPATLGDVRWWTGWTLGDTRRALAGVETESVALDGAEGIVLAGDVDEADGGGPPTVAPSPALLPALDPAVMGWAGRDWYLGDHRAALFDRNGNAGPTAWWDGRVVGGWAQRRDGAVVVRLLEDAGDEARAALDGEARAVEAFLGRVRFVPRFRTPLEQELLGDG